MRVNLDAWISAALFVLQPEILLYLLGGTVFGLFIGALPGLGPLFGVALMLPMTFYMEPATAIIFLASIHASCTYGDSWASVLINTPGGTGSVATAWDGFVLAQQGKSGLAMGAVTMASLIGGVLGWVGLVILQPLLVKASVAMGSAEYAMMGVLALSLLSVASSGKTIQGLVLGAAGLGLSFVGRDIFTNTPRFTLGIRYLDDGLSLVAVMLGLFAMSEVLTLAEDGGSVAKVRELSGSVLQGFRETIRRPLTILRAAVVGVVLGAMPGVGITMANIVAYFVEKRSAKNPESFGKGNIAGVVAPEVANNACAVAELVPTLALGIPGGVTAAILLAALTIHGVEVGGNLFVSGGIGYKIFAGVLLSQVFFFVVGTLVLPWVSKIVLVPVSVLLPVIVVSSLVGAYSDRNELLDVLVTIIFGIIGYLMRKRDWPVACVALGYVLGPIIEKNLNRSLLLSDGSYAVFVTRPVSRGLVIAVVVFLALPYLGRLYRWLRGVPAGGVQKAA